MKTNHLVLLSILLLAMPAGACEPVLPLAVLYAGEFSLAVMMYSVPFLFVVVGVKCVAFLWFSRQLLPWYKAILSMVAANIVSTLIGFVAAIPFLIPDLLLVGIPIVFFVSLYPARRYSSLISSKIKIPMQAVTVAVIATLLFLGSVVLFILATGMLHQSSQTSLGWYWLYKIVYVFIALLLSIGLTTYIEEGTISSLVKQPSEEPAPYLAPVIKANLIALLLITLVGALKVLPERLASPNFLISW